MRNTKVFGLMMVLGMLPCGACRHTPETLPPCTDPQPIRVVLSAADRLNVGEDGTSLPVQMRIYQLKGPDKIEASGMEDLLMREAEALGPDLLAKEEITLNPGEKLDVGIERDRGTSHLAIVAFFRRPAGSAWRSIGKLPAYDETHCHAKPDGNGEDKADAPKTVKRLILGATVDDNTLRVN